MNRQTTKYLPWHFGKFHATHINEQKLSVSSFQVPSLHRSPDAPCRCQQQCAIKCFSEQPYLKEQEKINLNRLKFRITYLDRN